MSSRKFFALFLLCAAIPLAAAKLSLMMGWFDQTNNNKGHWLAHEIHLLPEITAGERWRLVYVQAADCDSHCDHALTIMQQLYVGLGRKQTNVKPLILAAKSPEALHRFPAVNWQPEQVAPIAIQDKDKELFNQIVIVNQQGLVLLRYPVADDVEKMQTTAKAIRSDLLRLMNYDRGGA